MKRPLRRSKYTNRLAWVLWHRRQKRIDEASHEEQSNVYLFDGSALNLGVPFTGNLKVMIAAESELGLEAVIIAGRQGAFVPSVDPVKNPIWNQYEIEAVAIADICNLAFKGVIAYAKDNVWFYIDMGVAQPTVLMFQDKAVTFQGDILAYKE